MIENYSVWSQSIPSKEELDKIIADENCDHIQLAQNGNWSVDLWLEEQNDDIYGIIEISNTKLYEESIFEIYEHLAEAFTYTTRKYSKAELYWILPSAIQECIACIQNRINFTKEQIF